MLKSPKRQTDFCCFGFFSMRLFKQFLLKSARSTEGSLYMVPTTTFAPDVGFVISTKVDSVQAFIQALLSTAVFCQRFSLFTVCLVSL